MIEELPIWIEILFLVTCFITIAFFYYANGKPKIATTLIILWSVAHSILAYSGFYLNTAAIPPRFILVLLPTILIIAYSLISKKHRNNILSKKNIQLSTFLHTIRLPIEIVLFQLFVYKMIPELATFEGRNFDIIAGITAPIVGFLFLKKWISKKLLLGWNVLGLILVLFILFNGILSAETPFQQFGFEQPNKAIGYFPFIILPATIVPIVVWTHLSDIVKLVNAIKNDKSN